MPSLQSWRARVSPLSVRTGVNCVMVCVRYVCVRTEALHTPMFWNSCMRACALFLYKHTHECPYKQTHECPHKHTHECPHKQQNKTKTKTMRTLFTRQTLRRSLKHAVCRHSSGRPQRHGRVHYWRRCGEKWDRGMRVPLLLPECWMRKPMTRHVLTFDRFGTAAGVSLLVV
jgi:hypothetical protein